MKKYWLCLIASFVLLLGVIPKGDAPFLANDGSSVEQIKAKGRIVLGTSADYPPYEFHANIDGKDVISGFDIEIAKLIAADLGVSLEIKDMAFDGLLPALQTGAIDFVLAGMQATEERKQSVDFSESYYKSKNLLLVKTENASQYKSLADVSGKTLGVQKSTVQEKAATDLEGVKTRGLSNLLDVVQDVINGNVDGMVIEETIGLNMVKNNKGLTMVEAFEIPSEAAGSAVAMAKGNTSLQIAVDKTIVTVLQGDTVKELFAAADELSSKIPQEGEAKQSSLGQVLQYWPMILKGTGTTILVALLGVFLGSILGLLLALLKISNIKVFEFLVTAYVEIVRGTPLLIQIYLIFYGLPAIGINFPPLLAGIVAVSLNSAAYVAEIIRAGINAVDKGQLEAGRSLGMSYLLVMKEIIIPQAIKNILPALGNEFVTIIKESSIISIIGVGDLMYAANTIRGNTFQAFAPLIVAAVIYFVLTFTLSRILSVIEGKMNKNARN
ncbi:MAG: ABC transporter substrate-binding protein/permease [Culicoidibacterales bacterium]